VVYFRPLPAAERADLARRCRRRTLGRGERIVSEGEPCAGLSVIAEGTVEVRQASGRGREQILHTEGPGATLGEGPCFDRGGYVASAGADDTHERAEWVSSAVPRILADRVLGPGDRDGHTGRGDRTP
jgi:CRP/FNR family transcriptional regulator